MRTKLTDPNLASRAVRWSGTSDPAQPYQAKVGAEKWTIRVNDFPDEQLFTLLIDGRDVESFDDWPADWMRPDITREKGARDPLEDLSAREYQVFGLLTEGVRVKEIAARLALSPKTVDSYRASLLRKLEVHSIAELVELATRRLPATRE